MLGEVVPAAEVGARGMAGDRLWAVRDPNGNFGPGRRADRPPQDARRAPRPDLRRLRDRRAAGPDRRRRSVRLAVTSTDRHNRPGRAPALERDPRRNSPCPPRYKCRRD
ncbi:hypothetical protein ACFQS1_29055 [Paractinoplanes rhizophilus]|uniref:Uncharacterized protein n=1 Tax=Paractinoplanes rhizophilus TaxID=1416877 RepID=A0ABW2HZS9_9ACTN